jgi:NAD(P)-dependent dehydrogenase (short-subunit alcohol dehydrogenase family)
LVTIQVRSALCESHGKIALTEAARKGISECAAGESIVQLNQTRAMSTPEDLFSVSGQVVVVSGGSRGIGRAIAEGFAKRGAQVLITGRNARTLEEAVVTLASGGYDIKSAVCDVSDSSAIENLLDRVVGEFGRVDTLVNSAGVNRRKPVSSVTAEDYDYLLDINLRGAFLLAQIFGRQMITRESGCQIHIASLAADRPLKHAAPYAMSKAGLAQMTRALAFEWGASGVRVNGIAPGFIVTDLTRQLWSDPSMQAWAKTNTPQRRLGMPEDLVGTAIFLASSAAAFLTGQIVCVDGGFSAGWAWPIPE